MQNEDNRIAEITEELNHLKIVELQVKERCTKLNEELRILNSKKAESNSALESTSEETHIAHKVSKTETRIIERERFLDRNGTLINVGDTVDFLTPTEYGSTRGKVLYLTKHRVTSVDSRKRKVSKQASNLLIVRQEK